MKFFRTVFIFLLIAGFILYKQGNEQVVTSVQSVMETFRSYSESVKKQPEFSNIIDKLEEGYHSLKNELKGIEPQEQVEIPPLKTPEEQTFSVHNIEIGDPMDEVEKQAGKEQRASYNEYGVKWFTYHQNYQNFFMAAYDDQGKVAALYTNQDLISSKTGIELNDSKETVVQKLGEPIKGIRKGFVMYQVQNDGEYNIYELDNCYVTVFFDKHKDHTITALQIISKNLEKQKKDFFAAGTEKLENGFEYQLFDLTNAARVKNGLSVLTWDEHVKVTARKHSKDMADKKYFSHDSLDGLTPFDRLEKDNINYMAAGENIATGQVSSIFAHEGLMNSMGHRKNILSTDYNSLGVGVAFDSESRPFYTENFIGK
ncbi:CAP-associated domain-containing protein [Siminovitchia fordii]|uniref:CAP domain-containing protein n=1 Tax=Siminovitchia fordii TaxID=254759 RepID=A0ABQ4K646_9BACI|nr:CAP-associated domain-containing protein [Siminovitchia fordii]GIN21214.1 CAP domain-containing protein [Siminovitchia fordii]